MGQNKFLVIRHLNNGTDGNNDDIFLQTSAWIE
jgi:hypothetical protein